MFAFTNKLKRLCLLVFDWVPLYPYEVYVLFSLYLLPHVSSTNFSDP